LPCEFFDGPAPGGCETACTDGKKIYWHSPFFDGLPDEVLPTVLCHETWHCLAGHIWRAPSGADHETWNIAIDHETNLMLKEFSAPIVGRGLADPFPFPKPDDAYCADPQFKGLAAESIYAKLASGRQPKGPGKPPPGQPGGPQGSGGCQGSGQGKGKRPGGKGGPAQAPGTPQKGSMPSFGDVLPVPQGAPGASHDQHSWEGTLIQSAKIAAQYGNLPGDLEKLVGDLVSPRVHWRDILRNWLREQCSDDWNWQHPAMEYGDCGFILPSLRSDRVGTVVFASDWSGSTYGELVTQFHAEKQECLDSMRPSKLLDIGFDTRVLSVNEYVPGDSIDPKIKGGGGTSFIPIWEHLEKLDVPAKCVVVLTDGDGRCGDDPGIPVIWVLFGGKKTMPFGECVVIE
jgi:predicted metal-dependent peptidase